MTLVICVNNNVESWKTSTGKCKATSPVFKLPPHHTWLREKDSRFRSDDFLKVMVARVGGLRVSRKAVISEQSTRQSTWSAPRIKETGPSSPYRCRTSIGVHRKTGSPCSLLTVSFMEDSWSCVPTLGKTAKTLRISKSTHWGGVCRSCDGGKKWKGKAQEPCRTRHKKEVKLSTNQQKLPPYLHARTPATTAHTTAHAHATVHAHPLAHGVHVWQESWDCLTNEIKSLNCKELMIKRRILSGSPL